MNRTMSTGENALAIAAQALGYSTLKDKQIEVVRNFLEGHDVFGVLPTGYGKSICFACLPLIFDHLSGLKESSIVIVVAPLVAIMKDQVCSTWSCLDPSYTVLYCMFVGTILDSERTQSSLHYW